MRRLVILVVGAFALGLPVAAQAATGTVEGTVSPIAWAPEVEVCVFEGQPSVTCTAPAVDGTYSLSGVPVQGARIEFIPSFRSRLLTQYYDHKSAPAEATPINIPAPGIPLKGIDADLVEGGAIAGTVTAAGGGGPLAEVEVCALSIATLRATACAETDAIGAYELHSLPTGTYVVRLSGRGRSRGYEPAYYPGGPTPAGATPISVAAGETVAGKDVALVPGARITGFVTDAASGSPLAGIAVCLFVGVGPAPRICTESGGSGEYSFEGLAAGDYQVGFSPTSAELVGVEVASLTDGFRTQYYDGVASRAQAKIISLPVSGSVTGIDAALATAPTAPPPAPPPAVTSPLVPAPTPITEPRPKRAHRPTCKKGRRLRKIKGKKRCIKSVRHRKHRKHTRHKSKYPHKGKHPHAKSRLTV